MRRCYLVRHGQTAWNRDNRIQGRSDVPLSPLGEQQANSLGAFFASRHLKAIFTSTLLRSQQTARAIALGNGHGVSPIIEHDLSEIHLGAWEGLTPDEVDARYQGAYQEWRIRPSAVRIPEAESVDQFQERVRRALMRIVAQFEDGECVIVSHGGVIAAVLAQTLGADFDFLLRRLRLDNAGISALEFGGGPPHVLWINATSHLQEDLVHPPLGTMWF
jgi:broad specificity phosphatase PhoE